MGRAGGQAGNKAVIGKFPNYVKLAKSMQVKYFDVPPEIWAKMTKAEQWAANKKFLDRAIARDTKFILSTKKEVTETFAKEVEYLTSKGYTLSKDGYTLSKRLVK
jgi:hypothetical protein